VSYERRYAVPEQMPGESNSDWCERAAATIPAEEVLHALVLYFDAEARRTNKSRYLIWSHIGAAMGHGSGVAAAIAERFRRRPESAAKP